jgi:hypothetical protein
MNINVITRQTNPCLIKPADTQCDRKLPFFVLYSSPSIYSPRPAQLVSSLISNSLRHVELRVRSDAHATAFTDDVHSGKSESNGKSEPGKAQNSASNSRIGSRSCVTYQAKAPNAVAAFAALHTCPKHTLLPSQIARARKPANQKTIVNPSTPAMTPAWFALVSEKRIGTTVR